MSVSSDYYICLAHPKTDVYEHIYEWRRILTVLWQQNVDSQYIVDPFCIYIDIW